MIHKAATEKKTSEDVAASSLVQTARSSTISDSEMAMLSYQYQLQNLETYNLLAPQGRQLGLLGMSSSPRRLLGDLVSSDADDTAHLVASSLAQAAQSSHLSYSQRKMIMLQNQSIQNLPSYNLLSTRQGHQLGLSSMPSSPGGLLGDIVSPPSSLRYVRDAVQREQAIAAVSLQMIERDIQSCLETIAAQEDRLSVLMTMRERII